MEPVRQNEAIKTLQFSAFQRSQKQPGMLRRFLRSDPKFDASFACRYADSRGKREGGSHKFYNNFLYPEKDKASA